MSRWLAGAALLWLMSACSTAPSSAPAKGTQNTMRYEAGELSLEIPSSWRDLSEYTYTSPDEEVSVRVSHMAVVETLKTGDLLTERKQRFGLAGTVQEIRRGQQTVGGAPAEWIELEVKRESLAEDDENHVIVRLLGVRPTAQRVVLVNVTGPVARRAEMDLLWERILSGAKLRSGV